MEKAAYTISQAAALMATVASMQAQNNDDVQAGRNTTFKAGDFEQAIINHQCHHNQVVTWLRG